MRPVMSREEARRQTVLHSVGVLEGEGLVLRAEVLALREIAGEAPAGNLEAAAMLSEAEAIDRQRQVKVLALAHLQRMVGEMGAPQNGATQNGASGPQKAAPKPEDSLPVDPSSNALRAFLSALRAALAKQPDLRDMHNRPLSVLTMALAQSADDTARAEILVSAGLPPLAQTLTAPVVRGYATILASLMPGWGEVRAALVDVSLECKSDTEAPTAAALRALISDTGALASVDGGVTPVAARAAPGILQGLIYPAGRPQQLAQATLRVIIVRIALAEALADPVLA